MSYFDDRDMPPYYNGPPGPYGNGPPGPYGNGPTRPYGSPKRTIRVSVQLYANQSVEVRLNADSPWMVGTVLAVLSAAEQAFGIRYDIQYRSGPEQRYHRMVFSGDSPNIRPFMQQ